MSGLDPIPGRDPRLIGWCQRFRLAGYSTRVIAQLFDVSHGDLIEAGIEP